MKFDVKRALVKEVNVGLKEQKIRYGAGSAVLLASVFAGNIPLLVIGSVLVGTAFTRWCPAYSGLNKTTVDPNEPPPAACCGNSHEH
jgi:UTP-glucose-1-phosphate uridylyltransferase